jgi:hypothetical protein
MITGLAVAGYLMGVITPSGIRMGDNILITSLLLSTAAIVSALVAGSGTAAATTAYFSKQRNSSFKTTI